jgi:hypothetical protein
MTLKPTARTAAEHSRAKLGADLASNCSCRRGRLLQGDEVLPAEGRRMTEAEWLTCVDPKPMLAFLLGKASDRKLRLFACACCRRVWRLLIDERSRKAVEIAEQVADRTVIENAPTEKERRDAVLAAHAVAEQYSRSSKFYSAEMGAAAARSAVSRQRALASNAAVFAAHALSREGTAAIAAESRAQASMLRDLFGNPFRPVTVERAWLSWHDGTIVKLAQSIYDGRAFDRLPVLADALEEAGCTNAEILAHCRQPGEHVRGCWVVDLLLGKA